MEEGSVGGKDSGRFKISVFSQIGYGGADDPSPGDKAASLAPSTKHHPVCRITGRTNFSFSAPLFWQGGRGVGV